jgi:phosphatidylinositol alpha-1,6-mannosyltransferase
LNEGYKNLEMLIRLCAVLHPIRVIERLVIIGGGPRLGALREKAAALGLSDVAQFPGHLPENEVRALLAESHVGVFASRDSMAEGGFEGFGLAVHELAAAGLPVLVAAVAGAIEASHDPWARKLDPDDLWAWVVAIEELYSNEDQRFAMGVAALTWGNAIDPLDTTRRFARALLENQRNGARRDGR